MKLIKNNLGHGDQVQLAHSVCGAALERRAPWYQNPGEDSKGTGLL